MTLSVEQIVENGLCIGCGLCRDIGGEAHIQMILTPEGRERPVVLMGLDTPTLERINAVCPGVTVSGPDPDSQSVNAQKDLIWGSAESLSIGYAADPHVRYTASTGGVLTALGQFLLKSGKVKFIVQVTASKTSPMLSVSQMSVDVTSVLEASGSRYGPAAPLLNFGAVLDRCEPFAVIAKPCDISAVRNLAKIDPRVNQFMYCALTLVCGGASDLTKSEELLSEHGIQAAELASFRYRGNGNPGPTRIETKDGRVVQLTYQQMWEQESKWMIQPRCKICPDAIGEGADLAASDVWVGGGPEGEDAGFNGIIVRTKKGQQIYDDAISVGVLTIDSTPVTFRDFDVFQPHQVRKKRAVWGRLAGMRAAGVPAMEVAGLRIQECARLNTVAQNLKEARGARDRAKGGTLGEPPAVARVPVEGL